MSQIPAPLLSRRVGVIVVVVSVLAAAALATVPRLGDELAIGAIVLVAVQQAFLALAILLIGRTGLAGRHTAFPVLVTFGSAAVLLLDALLEIIAVVVVSVVPVPPVAVIPPVACLLAAVTGALLVLFGVVVLRAAIVRRAVGVLVVVAGIAVLAAIAAFILDPILVGGVAPAVAVLLSGGIGLALFTPRTLP
ncbi:hypothetical protein [Pseudolysinimonas sp.]|jgi:hypothetical protein|uniref:hypothetical protein n=1 Tax=Pseudolysinimonas sp. TaxID=2680009 RepID=UPI003784090B